MGGQDGGMARIADSLKTANGAAGLCSPAHRAGHRTDWDGCEISSAILERGPSAAGRFFRFHIAEKIVVKIG